MTIDVGTDRLLRKWMVSELSVVGTVICGPGELGAPQVEKSALQALYPHIVTVVTSGIVFVKDSTLR